MAGIQKEWMFKVIIYGTMSLFEKNPQERKLEIDQESEV